MANDGRIKNSSRNMLWGVAAGFVSVFLPFISRSIILRKLGADYLGISTLFTSILQFLSLTELGVGSAIVYTMYRPIAENDVDTLCGILNHIRKLYRIIGIVMLVVGTAIVPAVPVLVRGEAPKGTNVYVLYYMYLLNSALSYFFYGYMECLFIAHQRKDVGTKRTMTVNMAVQFVQIVLLLTTRNFYVYAFIPIVGTIVINLLNAYISRKMYPEIRPIGMVSEELRADVRRKLSGLIGTRMNSIVLHSSDTMIRSVFLGLTMAARYGNYYQVLGSVFGLIEIVFSSMTASIGDKLVRDDLEENFLLFNRISFANYWLISLCSVMLVCLYEPFVGLCYGPDMTLGQPFTILMTVYFYIYQIQKSMFVFKDAAGIWYADRQRPYVAMITNVALNLILVHAIGIYGIVISTIFAFVISLPWVNHVLFKNLFQRSGGGNLARMLINLLITTSLCAISLQACGICQAGIVGMAERIVICLIIPNLALLAIYGRSEVFAYWRNVVLALIKHGK